MLQSQEGIHNITVALLAERGVVQYDPNSWTVDKIIGVRVIVMLLFRVSRARPVRLRDCFVLTSELPFRTSSGPLLMALNRLLL
jgi:hypothetical protein